jgi:hypothetical protein
MYIFRTTILKLGNTHAINKSIHASSLQQAEEFIITYLEKHCMEQEWEKCTHSVLNKSFVDHGEGSKFNLTFEVNNRLSFEFSLEIVKEKTPDLSPLVYTSDITKVA